MKYNLDTKSNDELFTIIKKQDEYNQLYISETKEELIRRGQNVQLAKLDENYKLQREKNVVLKEIEIEKQNLSNRKIKSVLKWIFLIPFFIAIRPIMRSVNISPFERTKLLIILGLFLFIIYVIITKTFFPIRRIKK